MVKKVYPFIGYQYVRFGMKSWKRKLILLMLVSIEILIIFYVSCYTYRMKNPSYVYNHICRITDYSISITGRSIALGDENGAVYFFSKNMEKPLWVFESSSKIRSLKLSAQGDYLVVLDDNNALTLFSSISIIKEGRVEPLWIRNFGSCEILGIYSMGEMPPLVYILVKNREGVYLFNTKGEIMWNYRINNRETNAVLSYDGKWIIVFDDFGIVSLFSVHSTKPVWSVSTQLLSLSLTISINGEYIGVGGVFENTSRVLMLSLKDGNKIYSKPLPGHIESISISSNGGKMYVNKEDGSVLVLFYENSRVSEKLIHVSNSMSQLVSSPFSSYLLAGTSDGEVYFFHLSRPAPLWRFTVKDLSSIQMSHDGESIFVGNSNSIYFLTNTQFSEVLPGSRLGWGAAYTLAVGVIVYSIAASRRPALSVLSKRTNLLGLAFGLIIGTLAGFILTGDPVQAIMIYCVGVTTGFYICWTRKSVTSIFTGFYAGSFGSTIANLTLGFFLWVNGDERDIIQLMIITSVNGLQVGILCGAIGAASGLAATKLLKNLYLED
ncbi:PQQ-binding-like beta-propeller repeat protein [Candidatus Bathyarchaeota archaeon]|nr:PQQ-binding-like beta-propeller repeat protein [Candidatus Bathyarchaeota archaeon]